jgi:protein phosphatase
MFRYAAISDIGISFDTNDDRIYVDGQIVDDNSCSGLKNTDYIFAAVADGVGGLARGYEAAEITLDYMKNLDADDVDRDNIRSAIESANKIVIMKQSELGLLNCLRTTLAAVYINKKQLYVINAGDSRVYRLRKDSFKQLSKDHSLVQLMIDTEQISVEESYTHSQRNIITKCIGQEEFVNARIVDFSEDYHEDDLYMICSDGVSDAMRNDELKDLILTYKDFSLLDICKAIIDNSKICGSEDNISVCLVRKEL